MMRTPVVLLVAFTVLVVFTMPGYSSAFPDVQPDEWFYPYVTDLVSQGIVDGYPDGSFRPDNMVTRAEFAKMLCLAIGEAPLEGLGLFTDVEGHWFAGYVNALAAMGVTRGFPDWTFKPERPVTRAEAAAMVVRASGLAAGPLDVAFSDIAGHWAAGEMIIAASNGIIEGVGSGLFQPDRTTTRAEAAKILSRLMNTEGTTTTTEGPPPPPVLPSGHLGGED